ncbi:hypothetical protein [Alteripontixanthobacter maritimus]|nr:hypothetical protein [Alteripontixanthobacter maritimus]
MVHLRRFVCSAALATAMCVSAPSVAAAELGQPTIAPAIPVAAAPVLANADVTADNHRYRRYHRRGYRHHRRSGVGDVIAGVAIIGAVAAIANAASRNNRDRDYRYRDYRYRDVRGDTRYQRGEGLDRAANICRREIERDVRVERVDSVDRNANGWRVTGSLYNGEGFTCRIGADGRIDAVDYSGRYRGASVGGQDAYRQIEDRQWSADRYAAARARLGNDIPAATDYRGQATQRDVQPAYPGGPIPGEQPYEYDDEPANGG